MLALRFDNLPHNSSKRKASMMKPSVRRFIKLLRSTSQRLLRSASQSLAPDLTRARRSRAFATSATLTKRLHLGSGPHIFDGWTNVDIDPGIGGSCWDLERALPLPTESIRFIFTEHFIEHISREQCLALLTECRRVLKRDGVLRASTPNLRFLLQQYEQGRLDEWRDVGWRPATACAMVNEGLHCWGHRFVYDEAELVLLLQETGFTRVDVVKWHESSYEALRDRERRPFHNELICEARP